MTDASGAPRTTVVPGDVIPGEVVETDSATSGSSGGNATDRAAGDEPEPGPRVVRGEIAGPND